MDIRQALIQAEGDVLAAAELVLASARTKPTFYLPQKDEKKTKAPKMREYFEHFSVMQHDGTFGPIGRVTFKQSKNFLKRNMFVDKLGLDFNALDAKKWKAVNLDLTVYVKDIDDNRWYENELQKELQTGDHNPRLGLATFAQSMRHSGLTYYDPKKVVVVTPRKTAERPDPVRQYAYKKL